MSNVFNTVYQQAQGMVDLGYPADLDEIVHPLNSIPDDLKEMMGVHRFSDFAFVSKDILQGVTVPMRKVLGYPIVVSSFRQFPSRFPKRDADGELDPDATYAKIQFKYIKDPKQTLRITNTSSSVLQRQLEQFKNELPFATVIQCRKNYLTFT